jgi:hypothetical protein
MEVTDEEGVRELWNEAEFCSGNDKQAASLTNLELAVFLLGENAVSLYLLL